jgi:GWxTD domain-containing protein
MKRWLPILLLSALAMSPSFASADSRAGRAQSLYDSAKRRLAIGTPPQRQFARTELEDAYRLDRANDEIALALGFLYLEGDMLQRARDVAQDLLAADSTRSAAYRLQGSVQRRYWLAESEELMRDKAIVSFARGARLAPGDYECWGALVPLLVDANELDLARDASAYALRAAPERPEALLLVASAAQRAGDIETADRLFGKAIPRLPEALRERYLDVSPLLPPWVVEEYFAMARPARSSYVERFWRKSDPDPVSVENEAKLEYFTRVTQAWMLYGLSRPGEWDIRAQYYARFGPPEFIERNPVGIHGAPHYGDWLTWTYPDLGMRLWIGGTNGFMGYSEQISNWAVFAQPYADSLAHRRELDAVQSGWAVFHRLPAGVQSLDVRIATANFESDGGPQLLAQAEAAGGPESRIAVEWAVLDSEFDPVRREGSSMAPSACSPDQARAASFASNLLPGRYRVGMHATDESGRRGVAMRDVVVQARLPELALSDLVVTCSPPEMSVVPGGGVRLEPETGLVPATTDYLNAYFEIYRLTPGPDGEAQFEYHCIVRPVDRDSRGWISRMISPRVLPSPIEMSRSETTHGSLRRQFLSVPVASLPAGRYELEIRVRDVNAGTESVAVTQFDRMN